MDNNGNTPLYQTIVADPPWEYGSFPTHLGGRYGDGTGTHSKTPMPYPTMTVEEIAALPVSELAAPDAWLFLWTTGRYLHDAFHVADAWGFTYRQPFVWRKTGTPTPFPATLAPHHAEFLLVCNRGKAQRLDTWHTNVIEAAMDRRSQHSQKPEVFMDVIECVAPEPRLEMFSRRARLGWDTWGNQSLHGGEAA